MQIAIDITPIQDQNRVRGVGHYANLLIEALQKYDKVNSYSFFTRGQKIPKKTDLVHYPYFNPFFLTLPLISQKPSVVTVHDLITLSFPEHFPPGVKGSLKWQVQKMAIRRCKRIITDSQASLEAIKRFTGVREQVIDVIYLAPGPAFRQIKDQAFCESVSQKYALPGSYLLYVGDINWNKNIPGLLKVFSNLKVRNLKLVLVGKAFLEDSLEAREINRLIAKLNLDRMVVKLGYPTEEELVAIYNLTVGYLQPSFAEGFGLPVLEAMACGCPVASSTLSSLAEICGPAIKFDPRNEGEMTKAINQLLSLDKQQRQLLIKKQLAWVSNFSWEKTARVTIKSYEKTVERK